MQALVLGPHERRKIQGLIAWAKENPISAERLQRTASGKERPIGDDPRFALSLPFGYRCVFSYEEQPQAGLCRHLSISGARPGRLPHPAAVAVLMEAFGFSEALSAAVAQGPPPASARSLGVVGTLWIEEKRAVNVVEKV